MSNKGAMRCRLELGEVNKAELVATRVFDVEDKARLSINFVQKAKLRR